MNKNGKNITRKNSARIYIAKNLHVWPYIQSALEGKDRDVFYFAESSHFRFHHEKDPVDTIISRPVFHWFNNHWYSILDFCTLQPQIFRNNTNKNTEHKTKVKTHSIDVHKSQNTFRTVTTTVKESGREIHRIEFNPFIGLCIRNDGVIEGFMMFFYGGKDTLHLELLCVGEQRKKIGQFMIESLKEYSQKQELKHIKLTALPEVKDFYLKQGFSINASSTHKKNPSMTWTSES